MTTGGTSLDFTDVGEGFEPLPIGWYNARVSEVAEGVSKNNNAKVDFTFDILAPAANKNRKAWFTLSLLPQSLWRVKAALIALGIPKGDLSGQVDINWDSFLGIECSLRISHEVFEDKPRQRTDELAPFKDADSLVSGASGKAASFREMVT